MNRPASTHAGAGGCWPSPAQVLLLRAALLDPTAAREAWAGWKRSASLEALDPGSYRLLPLVYRNLTRAGVDDPLLAELKDVYRSTWCRNQLALRELGETLRALDTAGVRLMLLKGLALSHVYYRDLGLRPMDDVDLLVPVEHASAAVAILQGLGWRSDHPWSEKRLAILHASGFHKAAGQAIDLHWHVLPESCGGDADAEYWAAARPTVVAAVRVCTLDPTDELFHACAHGVRWNPIPPLRWIADAYTILHTAAAEIAWERLLAATQRLRLTLPIRDALRYLHTQLDLAVPPAVLAHLDRSPVSFGARCEYRVRVSSLPNTVVGSLPQYWFHALRLGAKDGWTATLKGFVRWLEVQWDCEGVRQIGAQALTRGLRRLRARTARAAETKCLTQSRESDR